MAESKAPLAANAGRINPKRAKKNATKRIEFSFRNRAAYDDATLARVIKTGISVDGVELGLIMPRYELDDRNMAALVAYLRQLSTQPPPGVDGPIVQLATTIAPNQDPARTKAMLDVLDACLADRFPAKNIRISAWRLTGNAETWNEQLRQQNAKTPAFALLSGLGGTQWEPVHAFCERERMPCLFPNVDAPGADKEEMYNFYFSEGVALEAKVAARFIGERYAGAAAGRAWGGLRVR